MKIGIVTVYDGVSNIGSYLQAYAMQLALEKLGHQVYFVEKPLFQNEFGNISQS